MNGASPLSPNSAAKAGQQKPRLPTGAKFLLPFLFKSVIVNWALAARNKSKHQAAPKFMLNNVKRDKWRHFIVGVGMGLLFEALLLYFLPHYKIAGSVLVFLIIMLISYGFELGSLILKKGHYDVMDAVAGAIGGLVGITVVVILA
jgi:glycopeptide antibiotics resistance protein